jgi:hypothetical protein
MTDNPTSRTLDLNLGAVRLLAQVLAQLGWYTETSDAYRAGAVLEMPELDTGQAPTGPNGSPAGDDLVVPWLRQPRSIAISDKQRETCRRCVAHHLAKGALPPGPYTNRLIRALGLAPEE